MSGEWLMTIATRGDMHVQLDLRDGPRIVASMTVENRELENALAWMSKIIRNKLENEARG